MEAILNFINLIFQPILDLGAAPMMIIFITVLGLIFRVKFSKSLEAGFRLAIAITGMGMLINFMVSQIQPVLETFVLATGSSLSISDVGWAPVAGATWASAYTLFFLFIYLLVNALMLKFKLTETLDVDIWNIWGTGFTALIVINIVDSKILAVMVGIVIILIQTFLKLRNADLMKPTINQLLDMDDYNPTTSAHVMFLLNPIIMVIDQIMNFIPKLDTIDFDAKKLNAKIGFLGSKIMIGMYVALILEVLILITTQFYGFDVITFIKSVLSLGLSMGVALELFAIVGGWFTTAMDPLSKGIAEYMGKHLEGNHKIFIGIDWPFLAARSELWAVANLLAPIFLVLALILPFNRVLPMASIIALTLVAPLLVVNQGKIIRMLVAGIIALPLFLLSSTALASVITAMINNTGAADIAGMVSNASGEAPLLRLIVLWLANGLNGQISAIILALSGAIVYALLWVNYERQMKKRNHAFEMERAGKV